MLNVEWRGRRALSSLNNEHSTFKHSILLVQPLRHVSAEVELSAAPAICPAHVRDRDEERCRKAIECADLACEECRLAAEAHRPDARLIRFVNDALFDLGEHGIGIGVVEQAEKLLLRKAVACAAVAADADAEDAWSAALALSL